MIVIQILATSQLRSEMVKLSGVSNLWRHRPSQMASVLVLFNFAPVAFSYLAIISKRLFSDKMSFAKQVVSSAYWETLN